MNGSLPFESTIQQTTETMPPSPKTTTTDTVINNSSLRQLLPVADPDFELRRGPGLSLLAKPAFLPSVVSSSFFTQNKGEGGGPPLDPPLGNF